MLRCLPSLSSTAESRNFGEQSSLKWLVVAIAASNGKEKRRSNWRRSVTSKAGSRKGAAMPIVYVHGVATRSQIPDPTVIGLMRRYLSDVISPGRDVDVRYAYWGDRAARFAWNGASRPTSPLLGQGAAGGAIPRQQVLAADLAQLLVGLPGGAPRDATAADSRLVPAGAGSGSSTDGGARLKDLSSDDLGDFLASLVPGSPDQDRSALLEAADALAHDPDVRAALAQSRDIDEEWIVLVQALEARADESALAAQGAGMWRQLKDRVAETLDRGSGTSGFVAGRLVAEFRGPINGLATNFIGDVFEYLAHRGTLDAPGDIPRRFLTALSEAPRQSPDEPMVVISHSMGGQIVYDAVTTFLPQLPEYQHLRVDFWCATASQVGLFEELKLFLASRPEHHAGAPVPLPSRRHLGCWWNVWDHNDFLSYTVRNIVAGVDDGPFNSGMGLVTAHSGYLLRPSFHRRLSEKIAEARRSGWRR